MRSVRKRLRLGFWARQPSEFCDAGPFVKESAG
jgi:hypothetical protein